MTINKFKNILKTEMVETNLRIELEKELNSGIDKGKIVLENDFYNVSKNKNIKKIIEFLKINNILKANDEKIISNNEIKFIINDITSFLI